jgi:hypothetical protein
MVEEPVTYPHFCQEEERDNGQGIVCPLNIEPACGWFGKNVACIISPCAITGNNACQLCANSDVEFVTQGECPKSFLN